MLAGVKVLDKSVAEAALREEQRAIKKEKKAAKKVLRLASASGILRIAACGALVCEACCCTANSAARLQPCEAVTCYRAAWACTSVHAPWTASLPGV